MIPLCYLKGNILDTGGDKMASLVKYKGCKRCAGDLFLEGDSEGLYITCLQCGAIYLRHVNRGESPKETSRGKVLVC